MRVKRTEKKSETVHTVTITMNDKEKYFLEELFGNITVGKLMPIIKVDDHDTSMMVNIAYDMYNALREDGL